MILLYPVLLLGAAAVVIRRGGRREGRGWWWFVAWALVGALFTFSLLAGLSIGLFFLPLVVLALFAVAWKSPHFREASGLILGSAALVTALLVLV